MGYGVFESGMLVQGGAGVARAGVESGLIAGDLALPTTRQTLNPLNWRLTFYEAGPSEVILYSGPHLKGARYVGPPAAVATTNADLAVQRFLAVKDNSLQFQGLEVRNIHDLSHLSQSTLRKMSEKGFAPKMPSKEPLVLHHDLQNPKGPIVELEAAEHSIWDAEQHPFGNAAGAGLSQAERDAFNQWRTAYWKARAQAELKRRGIE